MSDTYPLSNLAAIDAAHHLHPFSDMKKLNADGTRIIQRGEGVHIFDNNGKKYLDGFAGLWCVNIGYGRKEIADAVVKQMNELPYYNTFFGTTSPPTTLLAQKVTSKAGPRFNHVFFTGSGSEANDTWFRMARVYWAAVGQPSKKTVIARRNGYHGSTVAGASLGGMKYMHEQGDLPIPGIVHIGQPYWYGEGGDLTPAEFGLKVARELEAKIDELGEENVAAFVAEPIQGPPASSSRRRPTGRRSTASARRATSCSSPTRSFAASVASVNGSAINISASSRILHRSPRGCHQAICRSAACSSAIASPTF